MVDIGYILSQWESAGIFDYVLPGLLIFAVIFGILEATKIIGKNKGIHIIIALAIAGLAIGYGRMVIGTFFKELFAQMGIGIAVLLALLILVALFVHEKEAKYWAYGFAAIGFVVWAIITTNVLSYMGWIGSYGFFEDYAGLIIGGILLIGVIIAVATSGGSSKESAGGEFMRKLWEK